MAEGEGVEPSAVSLATVFRTVSAHAGHLPKLGGEGRNRAAVSESAFHTALTVALFPPTIGVLEGYNYRIGQLVSRGPNCGWDAHTQAVGNCGGISLSVFGIRPDKTVPILNRGASGKGSNLRPTAYMAAALPLSYGSRFSYMVPLGWNRTADRSLTRRVLYRLSYSGEGRSCGGVHDARNISCFR